MIHFAQMHAALAVLEWLKLPIMILFILSGILLILVVLAQATKGAGLAGAFGMGGDTTVLGTRAGTFLGKVTAVLAAIFLLLALIYAVIDQSGRPYSLAAPPPGQGEDEGP